MIERPVPWPNGAKVAVAITMDMDADSLVHMEHPRSSVSKLSTTSMLRYGPEVAIPRILETYRRFDLKQSFYIPAWCIETYPKTIDAIIEGGHEVGFHGYIHEAPNALSREHEHEWMRRAIAVIEKHTGKRPRGNRSPLYCFSEHTAELLVEEGFLYDSSLMGDDVPYILQTEDGELIELPVSWQTDDWPPYVHSMDLNYTMPIMAPDRAMEGYMAEFEAMRQTGGGLWIGVWHPFVSGRLSRWLRVEKMLDEMRATGDVWFASMEEIAQHIQTVRDSGAYAPRVDKLPFYEESPVPADLSSLLECDRH